LGVTRIGDNPIGGGGFSYVWRGRHQECEVAIKVLRVFGGSHAELKKTLCREALVWYILDHPNVQPLLGIGTWEFHGFKSLSLVTPWMEEGNLKNYLDEPSRASVSRRNMLVGIAYGLAYLHSRDVVHADIRAENILVDDNGNPRISDFGLSHGRSTYNLSQTLGGGSAGTLRFQAPELLDPDLFQCGGAVPLGYCTGVPTTRSDVYAFAITCVLVFSGELPHPNRREYQIPLGVARSNLRPDCPNTPELDNPLWILLQACWRHHPKDRPDMGTVVSRFL